MKKLLVVTMLGLGALSCSGSSGAPSGHALVLDAKLNATGGQVPFLTPSNTILNYAPSDLVGKPYLVAAFHAGFSPGNDPPIDSMWSTVPSDLAIHWATPSTYADGPYDIVLIIYKSTPITGAIESGPTQSAPAAKGGDLASFTLDTSAVLPGDPKNALGTIRMNVAGGNATLAISNRVPADPSNSAETTAAFANTILTIP